MVLVAIFPSVSGRRSNSHRSLSEFEADLNKAVRLSQESLSLIYNRYELFSNWGRQLFYLAQNIDEKSYDIIKWQFAKKIVTDNSQYVMVFGGSSVTAGHDNLYQQSYPEVLRRRMAPALQAAGIELKVRNIAQGNNQCFPSDYCYEAMGGYDPDFVGWEQSFNCGHNEGYFEMAARFALWSRNPGSVYYSPSGTGSIGGGCPPSKYTPPYSSEEWTEKSAGMNPWKPSRDDVREQRAQFFRSFEKIGPTARRFAESAYSYQKSGAPLAVSGISGWDVEHDKACDEFGSTPQKCNLQFFFRNCSMLRFSSKENNEYGNPHGKGASWHPTRAGHLFRGELISWLYTLVFLDALYTVQDDLIEGETNRNALLKKYTLEHSKLFTSTKVPPPLHCGIDKDTPYFCENKPKCFTDYHPHYAANMSLSELIVGTHKWTYDHADFFEKYKYKVFPDETHLELRPGYTAQLRSAGELFIKFQINNYKSIMVCGYHFKNLMLATEFTVDLNVPDDRLSNYIPSEDRHLWTDLHVVSGCIQLKNIPEGHHVLGLRAKLNELRAKPGISHILMWD
eukprot:CAMPEP_0185031420 /NCGR_PEP_ID=MMETSP1103-20130426/18883_1 /TAXON_ID=36769 /ORGANISM="Paraphysomonas bandaiensis, Strain Caron Lab Isolate" /LENGTH=564 /DNA_ID=CAMNT_0027566945 /DNA_START=110 /DNA_END=1804 /DNA_ORIENTATION=-